LAATNLRAFVDGNGSLPSALTAYDDIYKRQFAPLVSAATRIRGVLSWPMPARAFAFELLRLPGLLPYVIRKTRHTP
jgi:hypothetical protein